MLATVSEKSWMNGYRPRASDPNKFLSPATWILCDILSNSGGGEGQWNIL